MSMEDILKVLVDSRQPQGGTGQSQGDPMTALIGGLLGGGQPSAGQGQVGLGNMMGMLESIMGGGQQSPMPGVSGGQMPMGANDPIMGLLQPFVTQLAKKANIEPAIAMVVISFVVHKLLAHHPTSGRDSTSFNLEDMLGQISSGSVNSGLLQNSGMVSELAQKTGLDEATAQKSLNAAFALVGKGLSGAASGNSAPRPQGGRSSGLGSASKKSGKITR